MILAACTDSYRSLEERVDHILSATIVLAASPRPPMAAKWIEIVSQNQVYTVSFADENQVVGGHFDGSIRRWKIEDGQQQGSTVQAKVCINSVVVSQDRRWIVSGEWGNKVTVWNASTHEKVLEFTEHGGPVYGVDISHDSTRIASVDYRNARIFSITSGNRLLPPLPHNWVHGVKFSPDGSRIATASVDHGFRVYSTNNGDVLFDSGQEGLASSRLTTPLAWSPDSQQLFVAARGKITCFDVCKASAAEWLIHENRSWPSIASNGRFIACSAGPSVSLWDCLSHKQIGSIITHTTGICCVALSPSGGYLACGFKDGNIRVHNLRDVLPHKYFGDGLPLVQVSEDALKSWTLGDPTNTEMLLSEEITNTSGTRHYVLANRALIRAQLNNVALAIEDAKESLLLQSSPIGYIAMAIALLGRGDRDGALCTFDLAIHDCELHDVRYLLLLKSILVSKSGNHEEAIKRVEHLAARTNNHNDDHSTYLYTVLVVLYMKQGNYRRAIPLIERAKELAPKQKQCPPLQTISLIFGWKFNGLAILAQQGLCETLYAEGCTTEAVKILLNIIRTPEEEIQGIKDWIDDFSKKCATTLERVGDEAFKSVKHDDAVTQYSTALSLNPPNRADLLIKRSRALAAKGLWQDALQDADEAVKVDPIRGYDAKHAVLHGAKRYEEAIDAFNSMLLVMEHSDDSAIQQMRKSYIPPSETVAAIDRIVRATLDSCPLVVIDVINGHLCDVPERKRLFEADPSFKELISSTTRELDKERIEQVVARFFEYVMFSHVWKGKEPLFQDVNVAKSVWDLPDTPQNEKLRNFCKEVHRLGHKWAWSDTCCIDKNTSTVLNQSLTSMYKWYAESIATLVFLAGVAHPSKLGDLTRSHWMTRAWTLQELLAPKVIFFYDSEWKPYLSITGANHKKSPEIMQELADAVKISDRTIATFSPDDLEVREKLRLASTRDATRKEDIAYSLIGIFNSDIKPQYGEGAHALGHLLEEVVARSGEVTVLAWWGKSSSYNSCLPASISVYSQTPYKPPPLEGEEMETRIRELRRKLSQPEVLKISEQIGSLPPARFATRRLYLPCIVFSVKRLGIQELRSDNEKLYRARVPGLGNVNFTSTDDLPLQQPRKFVFAHPWIHYIRGPSDGVTWGDDSVSDTESNAGSDSDAGSDHLPSPLHAVPAPQIDGYTRALQMIARLGQPFNALLLLQQPNGEYKRVAAENEIIVSGLGAGVTSKVIEVKVLEVL
ncbi:hypothetical protein EDC04DRAFT_1931148 [Pisolithus marmoratus]|nr:hypothetical protein EDC04DRAFT_1931148 [Pisolithus marmoratus]